MHFLSACLFLDSSIVQVPHSVLIINNHAGQMQWNGSGVLYVPFEFIKQAKQQRLPMSPVSPILVECGLGRCLLYWPQYDCTLLQFSKALSELG